jgi:flagellar motor switch protein FliN
MSDATSATAARPDLGETASTATQAAPQNLDTILSIQVTVQIVLGSTSMPVAKLLKLGRGGVVTLDQRAGDPVSVVVNGRVVARGEVVVIDEEGSRFGVSLTEIVAAAPDRGL